MKLVKRQSKIILVTTIYQYLRLYSLTFPRWNFIYYDEVIQLVAHEMLPTTTSGKS